MSSSRGNTSRKRAQKYQNRTAFKNDLHDTSQKTKQLNSLQVSGVCKRCKDIIDWKIKYKKYKPLTAPRKCTDCEQKTIKHAYHLLCNKCAAVKRVCAKCCKSIQEVELEEEQQSNPDVQSLLKGLPERKRRTVLRYINKQLGPQKITPEIISQIEDVLSNLDKINLDDDLDGYSSNEDGEEKSDGEANNKEK